jgi:hypothetical protein
MRYSFVLKLLYEFPRPYTFRIGLPRVCGLPLLIVRMVVLLLSAVYAFKNTSLPPFLNTMNITVEDQATLRGIFPEVRKPSVKPPILLTFGSLLNAVGASKLIVECLGVISTGTDVFDTRMSFRELRNGYNLSGMIWNHVTSSVVD